VALAARPTVAAAIGDWRRDSVVVRLTRQLQNLVAASARRSADDVVAIGKQLQAIRDRLARRGEWLQWIEDNAGFGRSTANNYIDLAAWSTREPTQYARLKHLGPGKLYVLATAEPKRVRALKPGKLVALAASGKKKRIEDMTTPELISVIGDLKVPDTTTAPIGKVVQTLRFKVAAMGAAADVFVDRVDEVEEAVVRGIRDELVAVVERIDAALEE
jgi:hypothetical protein